jgi:hypothetical protein
MTIEQAQFTGLGMAGTHQKLAGYFGISVEVQRRIGTFIVLFSMIEQALEFVLMQRNEPKPDAQWPTDRMTVGERLKAIRRLAESEPGLARELTIIAEMGELLMEARHTVAHGAPLGMARLEKNRSWFAEPRKRPFAALELAEPVLDAAAVAGDVLYRLLNAIGARLSGEAAIADLMAPDLEEMQSIQVAASAIRTAMGRSVRD